MTPEDRDRVARMRSVARRFREATPLSSPRWTAGSYPITANFTGTPAAKALAWFPGAGCLWSRRGGCTMCDFGANEEALDHDRTVSEFQAHLSTLDPGLQRIHITPGGSFFDQSETPRDLQDRILDSLSIFPFLRGVGLETRPNLVSLSQLIGVIDHLPESVHYLTLGFGLECRDDLVREIVVNKGYGPQAIIEASRVIDEANRRQSRVRITSEIYVLLKPILLTESEGIEEAVRTIAWAYDHGAETAVLFMNTVKKNTIQGVLAALDPSDPMQYRTPFLRSALEVLRRLPIALQARTAVLGMQSGIQAEGMPRSCALCSPFLLGALMGHNFVRDPAIIYEAASSSCPCRADWERECRLRGAPIRDRVDQLLERLERSYTGLQ